MQSLKHMKIKFTELDMAIMMYCVDQYDTRYCKQGTPEEDEVLDTSDALFHNYTQGGGALSNIGSKQVKIILKAMNKIKHILLPQMPRNQQRGFTNTVKALKQTREMIKQVNAKIIKQTKHYQRVAKHGYLREALDGIFSKTHVNHRVARINGGSIIASQAIRVLDAPFADDKHGNAKQFYILDSVITGIKFGLKHDGIPKDEIDEQKLRLRMLNNLYHKGFRYVICIFTEGDDLVQMSPVNTTDFKQITNKMIHDLY